MKIFYILYYYPPYKLGWTITYECEIWAIDEISAKKQFKTAHSNAIIKGIEDYPPT